MNVLIKPLTQPALGSTFIVLQYLSSIFQALAREQPYWKYQLSSPVCSSSQVLRLEE